MKTQNEIAKAHFDYMDNFAKGDNNFQSDSYNPIDDSINFRDLYHIKSELFDAYMCRKNLINIYNQNISLFTQDRLDFIHQCKTLSLVNLAIEFLICGQVTSSELYSVLIDFFNNYKKVRLHHSFQISNSEDLLHDLLQFSLKYKSNMELELEFSFT